MGDHDPSDLHDEISRAEARLADLDDERDQVSRRISDLKARHAALQADRDGRCTVPQAALPNHCAPSTSGEKVALFMSLFRGRTDVFPVRWVNSKKGKTGYSPRRGTFPIWKRRTCLVLLFCSGGCEHRP